MNNDEHRVFTPDVEFQKAVTRRLINWQAAASFKKPKRTQGTLALLFCRAAVATGGKTIQDLRSAI